VKENSVVKGFSGLANGAVAMALAIHARMNMPRYAQTQERTAKIGPGIKREDVEVADA